jgi:crotonobetaine/carnitine-CoA ligase
MAQVTIPDIPKDRWTLIELVRRQAERYGEREFLRFDDGTTLTFAGLERESTVLAHALAARGLGVGDRLLGLLLNGPALVPLLIAANKVGAVFVSVNTELKGAFLEHQVKNSQPRIIAVDRELARAFQGVDLAGVETAIVVGQGDHALDAIAGPKPTALAELRADKSAKPAALFEPAPRDISTVIYTSGTTGPSKGVLMPHAHAYLMGYGLARHLDLHEDDVYYVCMPMFHSNGLFMQTFGSLIGGSRAYVVRRFSPSRWLDDLRKSGATLTNGLGVMPEFIFRQPPTDRDRDHKLRAMMAVPIAAEWGRAFEERFGVPLVQGYGMTEINLVAYTTKDDPLEPGCCGRPLPEFEVRIVDGDDRQQLAGSIGEIVVRPNEAWCFMAGYQRMPEKTVEAWQNLWFHTGDAGRFDDAGRLYFVDRMKDCIRRRGENISSYEVEQVIGSHATVAECAVIAVKVADAGGEEEVKACVVLKEGAELEPAVLLDYCQERMPRFAVPRFVEFVAALPKTATGKLQKEDLRRAGKTAATWDREEAGYAIRR